MQKCILVLVTVTVLLSVMILTIGCDSGVSRSEIRIIIREEVSKVLNQELESLSVGNLYIVNDSGKVVASLSSESGEGVLSLHDSKGDPVITLQSVEGRGMMLLSNASGRTIAQIGRMEADGIRFLHIDGKPVGLLVLTSGTWWP